MAYEVRMYYENYTSGVLTDELIYRKLFGELPDAVKKFNDLKKKISDQEEWKKYRGRVKGVTLPELRPEDFADGYFRFEKPFDEEPIFFAGLILNSAYGFDYEQLSVQIVDPETNETISRS